MEGLYLAFDTATAEGSVAVGTREAVLAQGTLGVWGEHAARLVPAIDAALRDAGARPGDLAGVVVGRGPGSFTGVRVAAATAKGLVASLGVPLYGYSSLAAAAVGAVGAVGAAGPLPLGGSAPGASRRSPAGRSAPAAPPGRGGVMQEGRGESAEGAGEGLRCEPRGLARAESAESVVCAVFDARGDRVYAACYRLRPASLECTHPQCATTIGELLQQIEVSGVEFAGDGAWRHREPIAAAGGRVLPPPAGSPTGQALLWLLAVAPEGARIEDPGRWEPDYLRASTVQVNAAR